MRFIADESCDFTVVRALRARGHDVVAVGELDPGLEDVRVIALALDERRTVLTEDKDFGQLVFASLRPSPGVILIRFPTGARSTLPTAVCTFVESNPSALVDCFCTLQPGRARMSRPPT